MTLRAKLAICAMICAPEGASAGMITDEGLAPYEICGLCHGLDGNSRMSKFPKLAGQPAAYLKKQIRDFLSGRRDNDGGQMVAIVTELNPNDIPLVAQWFASQEAPAPAASPFDAAGSVAFEDLGCLACHNDGAAEEALPHLTAQHEAYLIKQMKDFRDGRRRNDLEGAMSAAMRGVTDAEITSMARYLAAKKRGTYASH